nr:MAG TPA: hypothetical protein [Caudoviricetes sp.]
MSFVKSLIQRLLDSRTTPQQAKDCNDLNFSKEITVLNTTSTSSANFTYIAPDSGYIYRWIQCSGKSGTAMGTDIVVNGKRMSGLAINNGYFEFGETLRVNKGASVKFGTWGISTLAQYLVKFVPLGGGYNLFIWRALSCLKALSNFSQRNSFLAEVIGFLISPTLRRRPFISRQFKQANGLQSFRRVTDGFVSKPLLQTFFLAMANCGRAYIKIRRISRASHCLSQRAGQLLTNYQQTQRAPLSSLFQVSVIGVSALTGGTSC